MVNMRPVAVQQLAHRRSLSLAITASYRSQLRSVGFFYEGKESK